MREIKLSELILDYNIYPRREVDAHHAAIIQEAIEGGAVLPPMVIEKKTKRVVDGFHRHRAYRRISRNDSNFVVTCIEKTYRSEAELFLDAMRYNAEHGRALTKFDRTHCVLLAQQLEIADKDIAKVLHIQVDAVQQLVVDRSAYGSGGKQQLTPIKATIRHKAGQKLSKSQVECNAKLGGMNPSFYANQLIMLVQNDLINRKDENVIAKLQLLAELLDTFLAVKA